MQPALTRIQTQILFRLRFSVSGGNQNKQPDTSPPRVVSNGAGVLFSSVVRAGIHLSNHPARCFFEHAWNDSVNHRSTTCTKKSERKARRKSRML